MEFTEKVVKAGVFIEITNFPYKLGTIEFFYIIAYERQYSTFYGPINLPCLLPVFSLIKLYCWVP